ncbi:hypothetical protein WK94_24360 [Burkholderia ubonensis]|nr:hypothetical protein WK94_24360 [Burkholderia ubonensis]
MQGGKETTAMMVFASVERKKLDEARALAASLRDMFYKLAPIEKMVAAKQIEAVQRLVEAVEAL